MAEQVRIALKILRRKQVLARLSIANATLYDWQDERSPRYDPTFPKRIRLSAHSVGWLEHEIDAWIESRIACSREQRLSAGAS
ncbi:AlpA family phage regulatory protein [Burkholderia pseudomallei]|uniref:helix-turn-helix transcriptional regulator n=1 Tax=Burkholderia pseudomallei TaxID=28450 RepID=UPI0009B1D72B|nr:AlpA family phage regulatory protein [Burkholderia pseudomallei]QSY07361.1 AlpA family phage regulatory protein [Burkholderia pseudomallei]QSY15146.1 AlpA family phage regulatory protein [Burkholderia pseudomallei]QTB63137.1 AlpA family phage regulatory protein [Burkholderia pseudomallei]